MPKTGTGKWEKAVGSIDAEAVSRAIHEINSLRTLKGAAICTNALFAKVIELASSENGGIL